MASKAWYRPSALPRLIARFGPPPPSSASSERVARRKSVEVWTTTCIVTNFGLRRGENDGADEDESRSRPRCSTLVNPANPNLTGPNSFPYFPRGGPQPRSQPSKDAHHIMGYVSQWGGMDVGGGMLFSAETIDGLVHQLGGLRLRAECALVPAHGLARAYVNQQATPEGRDDNDSNVKYTLHAEDGRAKCPVGAAVTTSPGGDELGRHYDGIIHTTPPFYHHPPWRTEELERALGIEGGDVSDSRSWSRELLRSCYRQSFNVAFDADVQLEGKSGFLCGPLSLFGFDEPSTQQFGRRVAVPLLGAGCRAFPKDLALDVAALEGASWLSNLDRGPTQGANNSNAEDILNDDMSVVFGLLEETDAEGLSERMERLFANPLLEK